MAEKELENVENVEPFSLRFKQCSEALLENKKQKIKKITAKEKAVRIMIFNGMWHLGFYLRTEGNIDDSQFWYVDMNFDFSFF